MLRTKKKLERDCIDPSVNWFGNFESGIKYVLHAVNENSKRDTCLVGPMRFLLSHLVDRLTHPYTKLKTTTVKSSEGNFYAFELQRVIKEDDVYKINKILKTRKR